MKICTLTNMVGVMAMIPSHRKAIENRLTTHVHAVVRGEEIIFLGPTNLGANRFAAAYRRRVLREGGRKAQVDVTCFEGGNLVALVHDFFEA